MENKKEIITSPSPSLIRYLSHSSFSSPSFPFLSKFIITLTKDHQIFLPLLFLSSLSFFILVFSSLLFSSLRFLLPAPSFFSGKGLCSHLFHGFLFVCDDRSMHGCIVCFSAYID